VLKDETGSAKRKVIHVAKRNVPAPVELTSDAYAEAQTLLARNEELSLSLCWYGYALQRSLALNRFLFQCLGFESLAGQTQINVPCPNCGHTNSHSGSNKEKAYELYSSAEPSTSRQKFNREIWGEMRNAVFHGNQYPVPAFLVGLVPVNENLRRSCEAEISRRAPLGERVRARRNLKSIYYFHNFIEWTTAKSDVVANPGEGLAQRFWHHALIVTGLTTARRPHAPRSPPECEAPIRVRRMPRVTSALRRSLCGFPAHLSRTRDGSPS
jgi:hypothetical protein